MERLGHRFEQINIGDEARAHLGDNHYHAAPERSETPPAPFSNVPFPRDPDYVRRGAQSDEIGEKLATPGARVALVGLGGIGKSQLAIDYAHNKRALSPETWVLWMHAASSARFDDSVRSTLDDLKVPGRKDTNANPYQLLRSWLRQAQNGPWFIVVDNADQSEHLLEPPSVSNETGHSRGAGPATGRFDFIPLCDHGSVLITTRSRETAKEFIHRASIVDVKPMDTQIAVALMKKKLGDQEDESDLAQLADNLDCIPLTLAQAASYISQRTPRFSLKRYLEQLQESEQSKLSLLNHEGIDLRRDKQASNSIVSTWQISFEHIDEVRPSAADLLSLMSFFDRQAIPDFLLSRRFEKITPPNNKHKSEFGCATAEVKFLVPDRHSTRTKQFRLWQSRMKSRWRLNNSKDTGRPESSNHVQHPPRDQAYRTEERKLVVCTRRGSKDLEDDIQTLRDYSLISVTTDAHTFEMHALVQFATQKWLDANGRHYGWKCGFIRILESEIPPKTWKVENWAKCKTLFPHATAALQLDMIGSDVELEFTNLLGKSGRYAMEIGDYLNAERFIGAALKVSKEVHGCEHEATLNVMYSLAMTYWHQGRLEEAEQLELQFLEFSMSTLGKDDEDTLRCMANLAATYWRQGRLEEAEQLDLQVLESRKSTLGNDHPDTLRCMTNLAVTFAQQDRLEEAEQLLLQLVQLRKTKLGEEHPETLNSMHNLASTYSDLDRVQEAHELEVHVLNTRARVLGQTHPATLHTMSNLSRTLRDLGRRQSAVNLMARSAAMSAVALGSSHPYAVNRDRLARRWELELVSGDEEEKSETVDSDEERCDKEQRVSHDLRNPVCDDGEQERRVGANDLGRDQSLVEEVQKSRGS